VTDIERRMLRELAKLDGQPSGPGSLGATLWGEQNEGSRKPQAFARGAGKVLNRLRRRGQVDWVRRAESWGWIITAVGREALAEKE
jgi:hypothetical protein